MCLFAGLRQSPGPVSRSVGSVCDSRACRAKASKLRIAAGVCGVLVVVVVVVGRQSWPLSKAASPNVHKKGLAWWWGLCYRSPACINTVLSVPQV